MKTLFFIISLFCIVSCNINEDEIFLNQFLINNKIDGYNLSEIPLKSSLVISELDKQILAQHKFRSTIIEKVSANFNIKLFTFKKINDTNIYTKISRPIFSVNGKMILLQVIQQNPHEGYSNIIYLLKKCRNNKWIIENQYERRIMN